MNGVSRANELGASPSQPSMTLPPEKPFLHRRLCNTSSLFSVKGGQTRGLTHKSPTKSGSPQPSRGNTAAVQKPWTCGSTAGQVGPCSPGKQIYISREQISIVGGFNPPSLHRLPCVGPHPTRPSSHTALSSTRIRGKCPRVWAM